MSLARLLPLSLLLLLVACPTAGDDDDASNDDDAADPCDGYEASDVFDSMDDDEKRLFMTCVVLPEMTEIFQEFDAEEYADFHCASCHGDDREEVDHAMPNGLEALDPSDFPFSQNPDPHKREYGEFMGDEVVPAMRALLGRSSTFGAPDYFGCYDCHED